MRLIVTDQVVWSVSLSIGLLQLWTDWDAIWLQESDGLKEPRIRWGPDPPREGAISREEGVVHYEV